MIEYKLRNDCSLTQITEGEVDRKKKSTLSDLMEEFSYKKMKKDVHNGKG